MAQTRTTSTTPNEAEDEGRKGQITSFFSRIKKPGRPKKKKGGGRGRGRPKTTEPPPAASAKKPPPAAKKAPVKKVKQTRTNWSLGVHLEKMTNAVAEWFVAEHANTLDSNGEKMSPRAYSISVGIPFETLKNYIHQDPAKRRELGKQVGNKPVLEKKLSEFVSDVVRRADRGNEGKSRREAIDLIIEANPELSFQQASNYFDRTFKKLHKDVIKSKPVKAQKTTSKRSMITVEQQFRWFKTYGEGVDYLRRMNTGTCQKTGKTFGEVIEHFIIGGDETCFMASDGEVYVVGEKGVKKHEKKLVDSRVSITMYRLGSIGGSDGPVFFLMAGKQRKSAFTDNFLSKHGAPKGSSIIMTENAFMTDEAWETMAPLATEGIRGMPFIKDNPQWWVLEVFDGFGSHTSGFRALEVRMNRKILSLKEEADSSHVNQAYDKFVAKSDKATEVRTLSYLRTAKQLNRGVVDQWGLVHVGLAAVRETKPETWTASFQACNMDPRNQLSFADWCTKISPALMAGQKFKKETANDDPYLLLPAFWHGMTPTEKRQIVDVFSRHEEVYTADCIMEMRNTCRIPTANMQSIRMCLALARDNPSHLDRGAPTMEEMNAATELPDAVEQAHRNGKTITNGLNSFLLKPPELAGEELFKHMIDFRKRNVKNEDHKISAHLNVSPKDKLQRQLLERSSHDLIFGNIMKEVGLDGGTEKMAKRKLDALGYIKAESGFANDEKRMKRLEEQLRLGQSLEEIKVAEESVLKEKKKAEQQEKGAILSGALEKLAKNDYDPKTLVKKEISAILYMRYDIDQPVAKHSKPELVDSLTKAMQDNPAGIAIVITAAESIQPAAAAAATAL